jgi:hypothetical protein
MRLRTPVPMWHVQSPTMFPGVCAILPQAGARHPHGYIDTGRTHPHTGERFYVSMLALSMMAEAVGYRRSSAGPDAKRVAGLEARVAELEAEVAERDEQLAAVHTLKQAGYAPAKRVGRPPKEKAVA